MKRFRNKKINKIGIIPVIIMIIVSLTLLNISYFGKHVSPKLLKISEHSIDTYNNHLIMDFISNDTLSNLELNNLITLVKNSKDEIISIDYNIENSYRVLKIITNELYEIISHTNYKDITDYDYEIKDDLILYYPVMLASDNVYLNNLGPKVPIKIKFLSSLLTNLTTKVTNYGINNVLMEIYVDIDIEDDIVIPFKKESIKKNYNVLLSSKVIMGAIPSYLGTTLENSSPILQK